MIKIVENEEYLTTDDAIVLLETNRQSFYNFAQPLLRVYHFDGKRTPWYKKGDVLDVKRGKSTAKTVITLPGIFKDWTEYVRSLGMKADTDTGEVVETTLPASAIELFHLPADALFVKRSRLTLVDNAYICIWDTYYPYDLVRLDLDKIKGDAEYSIVSGIKSRHGLAIGYTKERYSSRAATLREQEQMQLVTDEPLLILQRASYTRDRQTLILYSDMSLRGNWFAAEREYDVKIWDE